jgi:hypothetical protein
MTTSAELKACRDALAKARVGTPEWMYAITRTLVALLDHATAVEDALVLYEEVKAMWSPPRDAAKK